MALTQKDYSTRPDCKRTNAIGRCGPSGFSLMLELFARIDDALADDVEIQPAGVLWTVHTTEQGSPSELCFGTEEAAKLFASAERSRLHIE